MRTNWKKLLEGAMRERAESRGNRMSEALEIID